MRGAVVTGAAEMSTSTSTATLILITISTATKPSRSYKKGDSSTKRVRESGSIIRSTAKEFRIATRERRKSLIARAPMTRSSHGSSFVDARNRADRI